MFALNEQLIIQIKILRTFKAYVFPESRACAAKIVENPPGKQIRKL